MLAWAHSLDNLWRATRTKDAKHHESAYAHKQRQKISCECDTFFKTNVDKLLILYIMIYIQYILIAQSVTTERAED